MRDISFCFAILTLTHMLFFQRSARPGRKASEVRKDMYALGGAEPVLYICIVDPIHSYAAALQRWAMQSL